MTIAIEERMTPMILASTKLHHAIWSCFPSKSIPSVRQVVFPFREPHDLCDDSSQRLESLCQRSEFSGPLAAESDDSYRSKPSPVKRTVVGKSDWGGVGFEPTKAYATGYLLSRILSQAHASSLEVECPAPLA